MFTHNGKLPYGAQYWWHHHPSHAEVRADFAQMRECGFTVIRIFLFDNLEVEPDSFDFEETDMIFEEAARAGLGICPTLAPNLPRHRAQKIGQPSEVQTAYALDDPACREQLAESLAGPINRYQAHPALWSWILWNEPFRHCHTPPPPPTWARFIEWLRECYANNIDQLNVKWFGPKQVRIEDFDNLNPGAVVPSWRDYWVLCQDGPGYMVSEDGRRWLSPPEFPTKWPDGSNYAIAQDWFRFNAGAMTDTIGWLSRTVKELDPDHPTHINPATFGHNETWLGSDFHALGEVVDIMGSSAHMAWHLPLQQPGLVPDQLMDWFSFHNRRVASSQKNGHPMITELQGGPATWSGGLFYTPTSADLIQQSLIALGSGLKGVIYWMWRPRPSGREGGEWGLVTLSGKPTSRLAGITKIGKLLEEHSSWLAELRVVQSKVAILHSTDTQAMSIQVEWGGKQCANNQLYSEYGSYRALLHAGIPAEFVCEREVLAGCLSRYRCLFMPYNEAMDRAVGGKVAEFAQSGGWVYGETPLAFMDPHGAVYRRQPGAGLESVFPEVIDVFSAPILSMPSFNLGPRTLHTELFYNLLDAGGSEVLATSPEGYPIAAETALGRGRSLYMGTCLTLRCALHPGSLEEEWFLADFARRAGAAPPWGTLINGKGVFTFPMESDEADAAILVNPTESEQVIRLALARHYRSVEDLLHGANCSQQDGELVTAVPPRSGVIVRLER